MGIGEKELQYIVETAEKYDSPQENTHVRECVEQIGHDPITHLRRSIP